MSKSVSLVNIGDVVEVWFNKTNEIANLISNSCVTADSSSNGSQTVGNVFVQGIFFANTLATSEIRGGNVSTSDDLLISSNVNINAIANIATSLGIGTNFVANSSGVFIGNSTANTQITPTSFISPQLTVNSTGITTTANLTINNATVANLTTNTFTTNTFTVSRITANDSLTVANSITVGKFITTGNSSVNVSINSTSITVQNGSGSFEVSLGDTLSNTSFNSKFRFSNASSTGTETQTIDSYAKDTYRGVEYLISCKDNNANNVMLTKLLCTHDDGDAYCTEYGQLFSNNDLGHFDASTNSTHVLLQYTPTSSNVRVTFTRTHLGV